MAENTFGFTNTGAQSAAAPQVVTVESAVDVDISDKPARDLGKVDIASLDQYTPVGGKLPVVGPVTDTELRAADVKVSLDGEANLANLQGYRSSDTTFQPLRLDKATNTLQTIEYEHHEIHAGSSFMYHDVIDDLDNNVAQDYLITVPDTTLWPHIVHEIEAIGPITVEVFEATDKTGTTGQTVYNRDRNSGTAATTTIHKGTSGGTTDGTKIVYFKGGVANNKTQNGTSHMAATEKILRRNTKYIFRVTSRMADNIVTVAIDWYEHTNIA